MATVVGVRFKKAGKVYYFDPGEFEIEVSSHVIVETARGIEYGLVVISKREIADDEIVSPLKSVIRIATEEDDKHAILNETKEKEAMETCIKKIKEHELNMKLVDVEYTFDNNKVLFYFTAEGRIDFRELVKDLAAIFKTRIELRQIGVRDESKMMGGIGICGRILCCTSFLGDFDPVSIKMAKEQGLSLNPTKISGACGRLMCCLKYEEEAYEEILRRIPKIGAIVDTPGGPGTVVGINLLKEMLRVRLDKVNETDLKVYPASEVKTIKDVEVKAIDEVADIEVLKEVEGEVDIEALKELLD